MAFALTMNAVVITLFVAGWSMAVWVFYKHLSDEPYERMLKRRKAETTAGPAPEARPEPQPEPQPERQPEPALTDRRAA